MDAAWEAGLDDCSIPPMRTAAAAARRTSAPGSDEGPRGARSHRAHLQAVQPGVEGRRSGLGPERSCASSRQPARLGVDRVDMYLAHEPDPAMPLDETLGAFDELVRAREGRRGRRVQYDGRPITKSALETSEQDGTARFEWVQNSYSLLEREAELEVLPLCAAHGLGFTPFSPLAGGWLTGKYRRGEPRPTVADDVAARAVPPSGRRRRGLERARVPRPPRRGARHDQRDPRACLAACRAAG